MKTNEKKKIQYSQKRIANFVESCREQKSKPYTYVSRVRPSGHFICGFTHLKLRYLYETLSPIMYVLIENKTRFAYQEVDM